MSAVPSAVASVVPWEQVCRMLDKVQGAVRDGKKQMLSKFIEQYRGLLKKNLIKSPTSEDSFFPVLRILLPALDRDRGAYGVKENKLAGLYIRILGLKKEGTDAQKLLNYRKPKSGGSGVGDFAEVAYYVLKSRCPDKCTLSLHQVDEQLTSIAENYAAKNHDDVEKSLLYMLRTMTATEQKWLIRVLLKDMHLGIGQTSIFNAWHPDSKDFYDVTNSILKVCSTLKDPNVRLHEIELSLFSPFRPMLAERCVMDKVELQMHHKTFYAETKYDGERSQIHKKANSYMYFSRNGFDFTSNFGENPSTGLFTPHVHCLFPHHVNDVILDGEMVGWSKKHKTIISKGDHMDVKNLKEDGDWQVCFCAFDVLYLNGEVLTNLTLRQRLNKLNTVIKPHEGRVIITTYKEVNDKEEVVNVLNEAIDRREEGIVLKDPDSVYRPASRKAGWIKVKPEYVDSLVPELDLLIVGGYYGKGRRKGIISHFLLAVAVSPNESGGKPTDFYTVTRVGSGYTVAELDDMLARLTPHMTRKQPRNVHVAREKPDVWINPEKSCVVQVKAAEITKTDQYRTGATLRFPRVETVRTDKSWYEILTTEELDALEKEACGKLATKHYIINDEESPNKKRVVQSSLHPSLPAHFKPADISQVIKRADLFDCKEMCVMGGDDEISKQSLETLIVEHGGTFSQHPGKNNYCIITDKTSVRVKNYINTGQFNVIRPVWVVNCVSSNRLLPWGPLDVVHLIQHDEEQMKDLFDQYGNSYADHIDEKRLKEIFDNIDVECPQVTVKQMCELDELTCDYDDIRGMFRLIMAAVIDSEGNDTYGSDSHSAMAILALRQYGGTVDNKGHNTTHLIAPKNCPCKVKPSEVRGRHLVTADWIYKCIESRKLLPERHYTPVVS